MKNKEILLFFAHYIEKELGIVYSEHNYFQLQNRLEQIAKIMNIPTVEELFSKAKGGIAGNFKTLLLDVATNNETSFFRDPKIFDAIERTFISQFPKNGTSMKIWSAACSTGQEPISVSILMEEFNKKTSSKVSYFITATDISERVLEKAKNGIYNELEIQRGLSEAQLNQYFQKVDIGLWRISPEVLSKIKYEKVNLKESFVFKDKFHIILCRNVLIYQSVESKKQILSKLVEALEPEGFLVLGAGESLIGISDAFEQVAHDGAILYRKKQKAIKAA